MSKYGPTPQAAPAGAIKLAPGANYQKIVDSAPAGAVFYFETGVHRLTKELTARDGQTFLGAEGAIIDGGRTITEFTKSGSTWRIDGQTQEAPRNKETGRDGWDRVGHPETVFIDGEPQRPVDSLAKVKPGTFYFDYDRDQIYIGTDPKGRTVEVGVATHAISGEADNVTVADLTFRHFNTPVTWGVIDATQGTGWTIEDNDVGWSYGGGIYVGADSVVRGNYVHDIGQIGIGGDGHYSRITIEGNELARNGHWSGVDRGFEAGGAKFAHTTGLIVRDNYVHDNYGPGLWTDGRNYKTVYEGNLIQNNVGAGIQHEISYDAVMRKNVFMNNGTGDGGDWLWGGQILIQNSNNVEAYDNYIDFSEHGHGITLIQQDRTDDGPNRGPYLTQDNKIHNNTFVSKGNNKDGMIGGAADWNYNAMYANGGNEWYDNEYYMDGGRRFSWDEKTLDFSGFKGAAGENGTMAGPSRAPDVDLTPWLGDGGGPTNPIPPEEPPAPKDLDVVGTGGKDVIDLGPGNDTARGLAGDDTIYGRGGKDKLFGGAGNDKLWGGAGHDRLSAGAGNDLLVGGAGNDTLIGGKGNDTFRFKGNFGHDTILDFATGPNSGDVIQFRDIFDSFRDVLANAAQDGADVLITASDTSSVRLIDVSLSSLRANDFHV